MRGRTISIRGKLIALTLATVLAPIWLVLFLVGSKEIRDIRNDMLQSSAMIASVVADSASGSVFGVTSADGTERLVLAATSGLIFDFGRDHQAAITNRTFPSSRGTRGTRPAFPLRR